MAIYYIDTENGSNKNDGLSPEKPLFGLDAAAVAPGDTVLFKRGTVVRKRIIAVCGKKDAPVTYGAYGEGELPIICTSVSLDDAALWEETDKNIWTFVGKDPGEAANFVFDGGKSYGTLRWSTEELREQGDFFDNEFGTCEKKKALTEEHKIYLYSEKNPAEIYKNIEFVPYGERYLADHGQNIIYRDLHFLNSGVHAIAGEGSTENMKVIGCRFENIGGAVWSRDLKIRYGNAVETWDIGDNVEVRGCYFNNIYDSAVTHQGGSDCKPAENFIITGNVFIKCGMAAYEQRDRLPAYAEFNNNICIDAGEGFSKQGETMPRKSEIWPQPMGHHVFLWRIDSARSGKLEIKNNVFYNAPYGAAIYSIISEEAEALTDIEGNCYYTENSELLNRFGGRNFKDFEEYAPCERGSKYQKQSISALLKDWEAQK